MVSRQVFVKAGQCYLLVHVDAGDSYKMLNLWSVMSTQIWLSPEKVTTFLQQLLPLHHKTTNIPLQIIRYYTEWLLVGWLRRVNFMLFCSLLQFFHHHGQSYMNVWWASIGCCFESVGNMISAGCKSSIIMDKATWMYNELALAVALKVLVTWYQPVASLPSSWTKLHECIMS